MMAAVREWLVSLVAVSLFLSLAQSLIPEGTLRKISSFAGGLLLLAALLCEGLLISALQKLQMLPDKYFLLILAALLLMTAMVPAITVVLLRTTTAHRVRY